MKVDEWYSSNNSVNPHFCIRITEILNETNTSGEEYRIFNYFYISQKKEHGRGENAVHNKLKDYTKVKDIVQIKKLEKFYVENTESTAEEKLKDFIDGL